MICKSISLLTPQPSFLSPLLVPALPPQSPYLPHQVFDLMDRDSGGSLGVEEIKQLMEVRQCQ